MSIAKNERGIYTMFTLIAIYADLTSDEVQLSSFDSLKEVAKLAKRYEAIALFGYAPSGELVYSWGVNVEA